MSLVNVFGTDASDSATAHQSLSRSSHRHRYLETYLLGERQNYDEDITTHGQLVLGCSDPWL